jgi:hypothetical protein
MPPLPVLLCRKPVWLAGSAMVVPLRKYRFHTASIRVAPVSDGWGSTVRPAATSAQIVAGSPAIAAAVTEASVSSARADCTVLSEVPPTITP